MFLVEIQLIDEKTEKMMKELFVEFHQHPELAEREYWTTSRIKDILRSLGITIRDYHLKTGVVAEIVGDISGPVIALRADIDALPLQEESGLPYQSKIPGVAHACGHDFHTVALLGAAKRLMAQKEQIPGTIRLLFEPSEERHLGAKTMILAGVLDDVVAIFGQHNMPNIPVGQVGVKIGKLMASNDNFQVTVHGTGSHAAMPHTGQDPIVATAAIITAIQSIVSRNIDPAERVVLTVGHVAGGQANNIIPDNCFFKGTIRTFSGQSRILTKQRFATVVKQIALAYDQHAEIEWDQGPAPVDNNAPVSQLVAEEAKKFMTVITPAMTNADDDFASFEELVPGCYAFIGSQGQANLHHSDFIANPAGLSYSAKLFERVGVTLLHQAVATDNIS